MNADRLPLFGGTALAQRIEQVEAQLIAQASEAAHRRAGTAGFVIPVAGGVATFARRPRQRTAARVSRPRCCRPG